MTQTPRVGQTVHYVSYGTPGGEYTSQCRAAIVTEVPQTVATGEDQVVRVLNDGRQIGLCVLNPTGMFFNQGIPYDDGAGNPGNPTCPSPHKNGPFRYCGCGWTEAHHIGGTWHWPEQPEPGVE